MTEAIHHLAANTLRALAMDAVQKAGNGHPGMPMGMADVAVVLWRRFLQHNPADPTWPNRDRFVLSNGHGSMLLYSLLHLTGYAAMTLDEIKHLRQWGSLTPGHPEYGHTPGVETTTGPLGQGISNAVGMAIAEKWLAAQFNRPGFEIIDHYTYVFCGDGDLMEGISHEVGALAGHLGLGKLIFLYDDNGITIDGHTSLAWSEDVPARFAAYGWHTQTIDGHDDTAIAAAIEAARGRGRAETTRPSLIACRTHIGFGSPHKQDSSAAHGEALGEAEVRLTKAALGWPVDAHFLVPDEVYAYMRAGLDGQNQAAWQALFDQYAAAYPELAASLQQAWRGEMPAGWQTHLPTFAPGQKIATRASSGKVLDALFPHLPTLIGGSADLTGSNKTLPNGVAHLTRDDFSGRYLYFGIREHGMGGILNGMALHGGVRPYGGTFFVFSDYMRPAIRLAALMGLPVIYVFTHDSIGLGEDGPTHQPIEQLMSLRGMPNLVIFRPADARETMVGWQAALENRSGPIALLLTRQNVPTLPQDHITGPDGAIRGGYVLSDAANAQVILIGTGSEVHIALAAQQLLAEQDVAARVVSMPSWELFERQPAAYREAVLPPAIMARVAVEAGATFGWARYVGAEGAVVGLDRFGASAPYETLYEQFGLTAAAVAKQAIENRQQTTENGKRKTDSGEGGG